MSVLAWVALGLAALPAVMAARNLGLYREPGGAKRGDTITQAGGGVEGGVSGRGGITGAGPAAEAADAEAEGEAEGVGVVEAVGVSVLIPARDEAGNIEAAVRAALDAGEGVRVEVVVLDDHSTDGTAEIVQRLAEGDARVRYEGAPELAAGWNGKQHACWVLAERARFEVLVWVDADVRLRPGALAAVAGFLRESGAGLVSGVPRQVTGSVMERLIVPQVLLLLMGYLPIWLMRQSVQPGLGAGCGQLFVADRAAYFNAGGHAAIRRSTHDGVHLPRAFRRAGVMTDLFDATGAATCRMYEGTAATWRGFAKNATSGMASPAAIVPWTVLLLGGHVLPWVLLVSGGWRSWVVWAACGLAAATSVAVAARFKQGVAAAVLRPVGVAVTVAVQWYALGREALGIKPTWRGRKVD